MKTRSKFLFGGAAAIAVAAIAAFAVFYFFIRSDAPPAVSLESALASVPTATPAAARTVASPTATTTSNVPPTKTSAAQPVPAATTTTAASAPSSTGLAGTWSVAPGGTSFAGYRVQENLATIGANTAVGRTSKVTGTLTYDGKAITKVDVTADLTTLKSDSGLRDNALSGQGIETRRFPSATFTLASPIAIEAVPADSQTVSKTVEGDLTLHGVTRKVSLDIQGQVKNNQIVVVGSTVINFADYSITPPKAGPVLGIDDHGTMEFQVIFARSDA